MRRMKDDFKGICRILQTCRLGDPENPPHSLSDEGCLSRIRGILQGCVRITAVCERFGESSGFIVI